MNPLFAPIEREDGLDRWQHRLDAAKGCMIALAIVLPGWAAIIAIAYFTWRHYR